MRLKFQVSPREFAELFAKGKGSCDVEVVLGTDSSTVPAKPATRAKGKSPGELSDAQLRKVVQLRKQDNTWVAIEKAVGLKPREGKNAGAAYARAMKSKPSNAKKAAVKSKTTKRKK